MNFRHIVVVGLMVACASCASMSNKKVLWTSTGEAPPDWIKDTAAKPVKIDAVPYFALVRSFEAKIKADTSVCEEGATAIAKNAMAGIILNSIKSNIDVQRSLEGNKSAESKLNSAVDMLTTGIVPIRQYHQAVEKAGDKEDEKALECYAMVGMPKTALLRAMTGALVRLFPETEQNEKVAMSLADDLFTGTGK